MSVYALFFEKTPFLDNNGNPLSGGKLYTYTAGTSTPKATYTEADGLTANPNPVVLNARGECPNGIYGNTGAFKLILKDASDVTIWTRDNVTAINDVQSSTSEWQSSGLTPTYLSATQFSVIGDQTLVFHTNRRVRCTDGGGVTYGYVSGQSFGAGVTTVTVTFDSGSMASSLSAVQIGLLRADYPSYPSQAPAIQSQLNTAFTTAGSAGTLTVTTTPAYGALAANQRMRLKFSQASTGTDTLNRDGTGAKSLKQYDASGTKGAASFAANQLCDVEYDGTDYVLLDALPSAAGGKAQDFRLTLTSGLPVTTADVTGATSVYCTPYKGNQIALYSGSAWVTRTTAEFSLALGTLTAAKPYDVFCYDNAGTPTLEFLAWTNDTTRATALAYQDGVLVKSGAATRRYLGTFYTTATTTTEDSVANRYLWNYYHRAKRPMKRVESTASWNYTTATYRQANGSSSNQLNFLVGVAEDQVEASVTGMASNSTSQVYAGVSIGLDSTTTPSILSTPFQISNNGVVAGGTASYCGLPSAGKHFLAWLEISQTLGTCTWIGANSPWQTGIIGGVMG